MGYRKLITKEFWKTLWKTWEFKLLAATVIVALVAMFLTWIFGGMTTTLYVIYSSYILGIVFFVTAFSFFAVEQLHSQLSEA